MRERFFGGIDLDHVRRDDGGGGLFGLGGNEAVHLFLVEVLIDAWGGRSDLLLLLLLSCLLLDNMLHLLLLMPTVIIGEVLLYSLLILELYLTWLLYLLLELINLHQIIFILLQNNFSELLLINFVWILPHNNLHHDLSIFLSGVYQVVDINILLLAEDVLAIEEHAHVEDDL